MTDEAVPAPDPKGPSRKPPEEAIAEARVRAPTRGNRKLEGFLDAVNGDEQVRTWWYMAQVHAERLGMSDHSWVHTQIVLNISLRLLRLLVKGGVEPAVVADHGMSARDAEVVVAGGALLHDVGMSIHRADHEEYSLFLANGALERLLASSYKEPKRTIVAAEILHAIIGHRRRGEPYTVEAGVVRVADALDMAQGRTRIPLEAGQEGIHSISAAAVDEVRIEAGEERPVRIEIELNNSAGIFQVDDLLATKIRGTPLEGRVEVAAKIEGETEKRLLSWVPAGLTQAVQRLLAHFLALLETALNQRMHDDQHGKEPNHAKAEKGHRLVGRGPSKPNPVLSKCSWHRNQQHRKRCHQTAARTRSRREGMTMARNLAHLPPGLRPPERASGPGQVGRLRRERSLVRPDIGHVQGVGGENSDKGWRAFDAWVPQFRHFQL